MNSRKPSQIEFTSYMTKPQRIITLVWILVHSLLITFLLTKIPGFTALDAGKQNLIWYSISVVSLVIINFTFLRRDFDILIDRPGKVILEILSAYAVILAFDLILSALLSLYMSIDGSTLEIANQNNDAIINQSQKSYGMVKASAVFLAPIAEELLFRAGVFGGLRKYNRVVAYIVSMLLFSLYHVWSYAFNDPTYWVYMLQYIPVSFILCRCYERSNTIWGSILFHMSWNAMTLNILSTMA